jgi:hypothetical protein
MYEIGDASELLEPEFVALFADHRAWQMRRGTGIRERRSGFQTVLSHTCLALVLHQAQGNAQTPEPTI